MKIFKDTQHSLFIKPVELDETLYLSMGVSLYFDLLTPGKLHGEQELWTDLTDIMGRDFDFDMGFPKKTGEFLVTGSCFAPQGETREASKVWVRIGQVEKELWIFGDRSWKNGYLTKAKPFTEMPVSWRTAYGGEDFASNPLGKGFVELEDEQGNKYRPAPNVENPGRLIDSPESKPLPSSFGPLNPTWPQRTKMLGEFNEKWVKERWPLGYPEKTDPMYFNAAYPDQHIRGFFNPSEQFTIHNMHPEHACIQGQLPGKRVRLFVSKKKDFRLFPLDRKHETLFEEVDLNIDTVWFLPSVLKGVAIYRGMTRMADEEYEDMVRVLIRTENVSDKPKSLEEYHEIMKTAHLMPMEPDPKVQAQLQEAKAEAQKAIIRIKQLPKDIQKAKLAAEGKLPVPTLNARERSLQQAGDIARARQFAQQMRQSMTATRQELIQKLGTCPVSTDTLLNGMDRRIDKIDKNFQKSAQDKADAISDLKKSFEKHGMKLPPSKDELEVARENDPSLALSWKQRAWYFASKCRKHLLFNNRVAHALTELGFDEVFLRSNTWIGAHPMDTEYDAAAWGLKDKEPLAIPMGLVFPTFDGKTVTSITLRPCSPLEPLTDNSKDILIKGSQPATALRPAPKDPSAPIICLPDELAACYAEQELGDCCTILTIRAPEDAPSEEAAAALKDAMACIVVVGYTDGRDGKAPALEKQWQALHKKAQVLVLPQGDDVFDAKKQGEELRPLVFKLLPKDFAEENSFDFTDLDSGVEQMLVDDALAAGDDMQDFGKQIEKSIKKRVAARGVALQKTIETLKKDTYAEAAKTGRDPAKAIKNLDNLMAVPQEQGGSFYEKIKSQLKRSPGGATHEHVAGQLQQTREMLGSQGALTPEADTKLQDRIRALQENAQRSSASKRHKMQLLQRNRKKLENYMPDADALQKKMEAAKAAGKKPSMGLEDIPPGMQKQFEKKGMRMDFLKKYDRESLQQLLETKDLLEELNFDDIDCSDLDFSNKILKRVIFDSCNLEKATFSNTQFDSVSVTDCNLKKADFKQAKLEKTIIQNCKLRKADFSEASILRSCINTSDCSKANFSDVTLEFVCLDECKLDDAVFKNLKGSFSAIDECSMNGVDFTKASLTRSMVNTAELHKADFSESDLESTLFSEAKGKKVKFKKAKLFNTRFNEDSEFPEADLDGANLEQAYINRTDMSGATFRNGRLVNSIIERSDLTKADLHKVVMNGTRIQKTDLEQADMHGVNLLHGSLKKARLVAVDLTNANLYATEFFKTVFGNTRLSGANLNKSNLQRVKNYL